MDDERRKQLGSAPTTPAPERTLDASNEPRLAAGSDPDSTLDMPPAAAQPPSTEEPVAGAAIGRFVVRRRLGAGGMGVVLAGEDVDLARQVAIKLVRSETPAYRARLLREAQAMARLEHPNIVRVYEVGTDRGRLFIAMELVEGDTLTTWMRTARPWREVIAMFRQVGAGLAAVHASGLVHRDFKPDNVLVDQSGRARVADFGLARLDRDDASPIAEPLTNTGVMMGTPGYMAPEQQLGSGVDARADQYSFCVALREALGGRPLDDKRWAEVPSPIRAAIARGLSYDASERFASLAELISALEPNPTREPRWILPLAALAVVGGVAGIVAYASSHRGEPPAPPAPAPVAVPAPTVDPKLASSPPDAAPAVVAPDAVVAATPAPPPPRPAPKPPRQPLARAKPGAPGHLDIVKAAIRELGYDGFDLAAFDRAPAEVESQLAADAASADGAVDANIAKVKLAMGKRRRGDCATAKDLLREARFDLNLPEPAPTWEGRSSFVFSLCEIGEGRSDDAYHVIMRAAIWAKSDQVSLAMGFIDYELENDTAMQRLRKVRASKDPRVQAALKRWVDGFGLDLDAR